MSRKHRRCYLLEGQIKLDGWREKSSFLGKNKETLDANLWAILDTLNIPTKETVNAKDTPLTIFCDSQKALEAIQHSPLTKKFGS